MNTRRWYGKLLGVIAGALLLRFNPLLGALIGGLLGHVFDSDWLKPKREDPYAILGLTYEASDEEVEQAYRRLIAQYHPDRMQGVAEELREQAEQRSREINVAYRRIKTLRRK